MDITTRIMQPEMINQGNNKSVNLYINNMFLIIIRENIILYK